MVTEKFQNTLNMIAKMFPIYYLELVLCFLFLVFLITQTTQCIATFLNWYQSTSLRSTIVVAHRSS